jgi:hypothetical protein
MRGVGGACKHIQCPLLHSARVRGLSTLVLAPRVLKNNQVSLRTPTSARISTIAFSSSSLRLKKGEREKGEEVKRKD